MRPRYIILGLALVAAAALVIMGPLRGRSVKETLSDLAGTLTAALPGFTGTSIRAASMPSRPWTCVRG